MSPDIGRLGRCLCPRPSCWQAQQPGLHACVLLQAFVPMSQAEAACQDIGASQTPQPGPDLQHQTEILVASLKMLCRSTQHGTAQPDW